jgi:hypothetical protein
MEGLHDRTESKVEFPKIIETDNVGDANSDNDDQFQVDPQSTASRQDIPEEATPRGGSARELADNSNNRQWHLPTAVIFW